MRLSIAVCLLAISFAFSAASTVAAEGLLKVGVAEADITPPLAFPMAGYYHERLATGTIDPLKAKAIVFRSDSEQAALVVCDLIGIAKDLSEQVRKLAAARTGIPARNIIVSGTHTHTAPAYTKDLYDYLQSAGAARESGKGTYAARLIAGIVKAIESANERARPAVLAAGSARQEAPVSFNRRFVMRDGSVRTWMSLDNPEVVRPAGPIDPEIGIAVVRYSDGKAPAAVLSNFALHLDTVGGLLWSADYPNHIQELLRKSLGQELTSIFGTGCCGDINHVDPSRKERNKADFIGRSLGQTILTAIPQLRDVSNPSLRVRSSTVHVPLQRVTAEQLDRARPLLLEARAGKKTDFYDLVAAHKAVVLDHLRNKTPSHKASDLIDWGLSHTWAGVGEHLPVEVHAIGLGEELAIVCLPGEVFVELGLAIKRASPFRTTLLIELSNCVETIYIPTRAAYASGSYEVTNAALQPGSGEMLVEAAIWQLRDIAAAGRSKPTP